jgi:putative tryptophan/tyrosine transport system substrate-binding protein
MRRREFIAVAGAAAAWPFAASAQQRSMPVVGFLTATLPLPSFVTAFREGLKKLGFVEGMNLTIEYRSAEGEPRRLPALAEALVQDQVAAIVAPDSSGPALAAKAATKTIPIVFATGLDPVARGLVASLARPGGNITGVYVLTVGLIAKRLDLLHKLVPTATAIGLLLRQGNTPGTGDMEREQAAAKTLGVNLEILNPRSEDEIELAFAKMATQPIDALVVGSDPLFRTQKDQIVALAARHAIPTIYETRVFATAGGLMRYGPDDDDIARQIGVYTGRILKGEKPENLPVLQPTKFDLVINLKTAKTLGLAIPPDVLAIAEEVIE